MVNVQIVIILLMISLTTWLTYRAFSHHSNYLHYSAPPERPMMRAVPNSSCVTPQNRFSSKPQYWLHYSIGPIVEVTGWPSQGGVYKLSVRSRVELEFLGLDLLKHTLRPSMSDPEWQNKENAHCDRMRCLGPTWWENEARYIDLRITGEKSNRRIYVGWPTSGGVWVWEPTAAEAHGKGSAKLSYVNTMDERCELIKSMGGVFYSDPKACPDLDLP